MKLLLSDVYKFYRNNCAINNFNMEFTSGIYGLLGPNGAGKSTIMKMLTDNEKPTTGIITIDGTSIYEMGKDYRAIVGYMPQQQKMYAYFTGKEFLGYMCALKGLDKKRTRKEIDNIVSELNLNDIISKKIGTCSGGMKQRLLLAQSLIGEPSILLLDEPTAGLDPMERIRVRNYISKIAKDKIVIIATHVAQDIEYIAKELVFLKKGKIVESGTAEKILSKIDGKIYDVEIHEKYIDEILSSKQIVSLYGMKDNIRARVILDKKENDERFIKMEKVNPNIEDLYLYIYDEEKLFNGKSI